jgi:chromosome segregation ATPase
LTISKLFAPTDYRQTLRGNSELSARTQQQLRAKMMSGAGLTGEKKIKALQASVKALQTESQKQLDLEYESQATFEYLKSEVNGLRTAFSTLSDVLMEEINALRANDQFSNFGAVNEELKAVRREMEERVTREREMIKEIDMLKITNARYAEWMQQFQRDAVEVRERENKLESRITMNAQNQSLIKTDVEQQIEHFRSQLMDYQAEIERHEADVKFQGQQRVDDVEQLEKAISKMQSQQARNRTLVDEQIEASNTDIKTLAQRIQSLTKKSTHQFDNFNRGFKVFAAALGVGLPSSSGGGASTIGMQ